MALTVGSSSFADPAIGLHDIAGQYWLSCHYSGAKYAIEKVHAPGEAGSKVKRHGFSGRTIECEVVIVGASASACGTALATVETNALNQAVTIGTPDGLSLANCEVTDIEMFKGPRKTGNGKYMCHVRITADQLRNL